MSRIGKKPIQIPQGVEVKIEGQKIIVKGPQGELQREIQPEIKLEIRDGQIFVSPQINTKKTKAFWGLTRALIFNMIKGVTEGFEKKLEIQGVGYKASLEGKEILLSVGYTHPVKLEIPEGINISIEKNVISVSGPDKEKVGQMAAKIKKVKPPDPYKGKGIRYLGEEIRKKVGKKAVTGAT